MLESEILVSQYIFLPMLSCYHVKVQLTLNGDFDSPNSASNILPQFI
jgi:hypothetical protein